MEGQVDDHGFSWTRETVCCPVLDVSSSELPCCHSGGTHDFSVDRIKFWPVEVGAVDVEEFLLSSGLEEEELSWCLLIFSEIDSTGDSGLDILGDVGADSYLFGDVAVNEGGGVQAGIVV